MKKNILVFTNGEKIGDGIIKLPLIKEIKKRLPDRKLIWLTNKGTTVYNNRLKNVASQFIDEIIEQAELNPFFWNNISNKYDLNNKYYEYIFDTQKAFMRTLALKRIRCSNFISATASGIFSTIKIPKKNSSFRQYYLDDLFELLNLIQYGNIEKDYKINIPENLNNKIKEIFNKNEFYLGIAPGAGEKNKIWPLENFIYIAKYFEKKQYRIVFFLGPEEKGIKEKISNIFPKAIFPEEEISDFSSPEVVMASTKFLSCALANDSGISHILSTNHCPLIKLFGPKDSAKFTPDSKNILTIHSKQFGSNSILSIPREYVLKKINEVINEFQN